MTKEAPAVHKVQPSRGNHATAFSLLVLLLALLGVIVAAFSQAPTVWMLIWPTPLVLIFTAARFIREGVHKRDGVVVLGRPALGRGENVKPGTAPGLAIHRHIRKNQRRSWRYNIPYVLEKGTVG
jgi:hypothetical protein